MYDLPLAEGVTEFRACKYWKTQDGVVSLYGEPYLQEGLTGDNTFIAVLPEGFRPKTVVSVPATYYSLYSGFPRCAGSIIVDTNGAINARISELDIHTGYRTHIFLNATFLCKD